eukprot:Polyplicarium_translucidae@DN2500_c0_g1_i5.p3
MRVEATRSAVRRRINAVPSRHCKRSTAASRQRATATVHLLLETFGQNCSIRRACREDRLRAERARVAQARGTRVSVSAASPQPFRRSLSPIGDTLPRSLVSPDSH